jgi:hypothetical protein
MNCWHFYGVSGILIAFAISDPYAFTRGNLCGLELQLLRPNQAFGWGDAFLECELIGSVRCHSWPCGELK